MSYLKGMSTHFPLDSEDESDLLDTTFFDLSEPNTIVLVPRKGEISITKIVRERLATLGLSQIPTGALALLAQKLSLHTQNQALRSITPRAVARAILATTSPVTTTSHCTKEVAQSPKPTA